MGKVSNQGAASLAIYHNYYCRSLTGMEIMGSVTGSRGMLEERARPSKRGVTVNLHHTSAKVVFNPARSLNLRYPISYSCTRCQLTN